MLHLLHLPSSILASFPHSLFVLLFGPLNFISSLLPIFINLYPLSLSIPLSLPPFLITTSYSSHNMLHFLLPYSHTSSIFCSITRCIRLVFTLPLSLPPTTCSYLRLCKEWLDLRPAATAATPLSPMVLPSRLHYIIQSETHTHMY